MKCPKCGYTSFDHLSRCSKCSTDLTELRDRCGFSSAEYEQLNVLRHKHPGGVDALLENNYDDSSLDAEFDSFSEEPQSDSDNGIEINMDSDDVLSLESDSPQEEAPSNSIDDLDFDDSEFTLAEKPNYNDSSATSVERELEVLSVMDDITEDTMPEIDLEDSADEQDIQDIPEINLEEDFDSEAGLEDIENISLEDL